MSKELRLSQISHKTFAISIRNIEGYLLSNIYQLLKKYGGRWNMAIQQFQIPFINVALLFKQIKKIQNSFTIKEVPLHLLRGVLTNDADDNNLKRTITHSSRCKMTRILAYDPLLLKKYDFIKNLLIAGKSKTQQKGTFKKVLLFCWRINLSKWIQKLQGMKLYYQQVDYMSFTPQECYKVTIRPLTDHQIQILTYQKWLEIGQQLTKRIMQKYTTVICDDCDAWLTSVNIAHRQTNDINRMMTKLLTQNYSDSKQLIMFVSKLPINQPHQMLVIANLMLPKQYWISQKLVNREYMNDVSWMKKRYNKQNKNIRQFYFILCSTFVVNLLQVEDKSDNHKIARKGISERQNVVNMELQINVAEQYKTINRKYKSVNQEQALANLQKERSKGNYAYSDTHQLEQAKFIKQFSQMMIQAKLPTILRYINHISKQLSLKSVIIVDNEWGFDKIQRYLKDQQITYIVYQIKLEDINNNKTMGYHQFNLNNNIKVCIIIREKVNNQYKKIQLERQKQFEIEMQEKAEDQLGIERGGFNQLAAHKRPLFDALFGTKEELVLKKINSAHHIFDIDSYWYYFNEDKEKIVANIIDAPLLGFKEDIVNNLTKKQEQTITDWKKLTTNKTIQLVKHYFISKNSKQKVMYAQYCHNLSTLKDEEQKNKGKKINQTSSIKQFQNNMLEKARKRYNNYKWHQQTYDVDQDYDRIEYEALLQKQKQDKQQINDQKPKYNTFIEGLVPETPCLKEFKSSMQIIERKRTEEIVQPQTNVQSIEWFKEQNKIDDDQGQHTPIEEQSIEEDHNIDINKYIIQQEGPQLQQQQIKENVQTQIQQPQNNNLKKQYSADDSYLDEECISIKITPKQIVQNKAFHNLKKLSKKCKNYDSEQFIKQKVRAQSADRMHQLKQISLKQQSIFPQIIDVDDIQDIKNNYKRTTKPHAPSFSLWGSSKSNKIKQIARKYPILKVKLNPYQSSLL